MPEDMSKRRTLLKDERLNPKLMRDMRMSQSTNIVTTEPGLQPYPVEQGEDY